MIFITGRIKACLSVGEASGFQRNALTIDVIVGSSSSIHNLTGSVDIGSRSQVADDVADDVGIISRSSCLVAGLNSNYPRNQLHFVGLQDFDQRLFIQYISFTFNNFSHNEFTK